MYAHVALYDDATGLIYIHGGMSFHDEQIKPSNRTYAVTPSDEPVWNYIESHPADKDIVSTIFSLNAPVPRGRKKCDILTFLFSGVIFSRIWSKMHSSMVKNALLYGQKCTPTLASLDVNNRNLVFLNPLPFCGSPNFPTNRDWP